MNYQIINQTMDARPLMNVPNVWGLSASYEEGDYTCKAEVKGLGFVVFHLYFSPTADTDLSKCEWNDFVRECVARASHDAIAIESGYSLIDGFDAVIVMH